jgi:hypothetical protein
VPSGHRIREGYDVVAAPAAGDSRASDETWRPYTKV